MMNRRPSIVGLMVAAALAGMPQAFGASRIVASAPRILSNLPPLPKRSRGPGRKRSRSSWHRTTYWPPQARNGKQERLRRIVQMAKGQLREANGAPENAQQLALERIDRAIMKVVSA